jgi:hypothetical protein
MAEDLHAAGWQVSRLADFVKHAKYLRSERAPKRGAKIAELRDEERLIVPIEAHLDAAHGTVPQAVSPNRCLLVSLTPEINGTFLAAWLNSDDGRQARAVAMPGTGRSPRTVSKKNLRRFQDQLVVPVPSPDVQVAVADTVVLLSSMRQLAGQLATELWRTPSLASQVHSVTRRRLDSAVVTPSIAPNING